MTAVFAEAERLFHTALLGFRFFDRATAQAVHEGLSVTELSTGRPAVPNRSGVGGASGLPGMRDAEQRRPDEAYWDAPPGRRPFTFELRDALGRFHDVRFDAIAPTRGVFREDCGLADSPPDAAVAAVPLFSLPARPVPAASASVRAELTDALTGGPASFAVLEVSAPGLPVARGIADRDGRVLVLLPYPEPLFPSSSSPPGGVALSQQSWPVGIAVRYSPAASSPPAADADAGPPDLCTVLTQTPATLESGSPIVPVEADELAFGRELVLNAGERRTLLVTPVP